MNLRLLKQPHLTEKTMRQKEDHNKIVFMVDRKANKVEIRKTVEKQFKVTVLGVHTVSVKGKIKRMGKHSGKRPDWKKAIITLKQGDHIEYFEGA